MKKNNKRRLGFTLVELLLVIAILGVLGTVVVMNTSGIGEKGAKTATMTSISTIKQAIETYKISTLRSTPPKSLDDLCNGINDDEPLLDASSLRDAWGNEFDYKVEGKKYRIISAGPDGAFGTEDDLSN